MNPPILHGLSRRFARGSEGVPWWGSGPVPRNLERFKNPRNPSSPPHHKTGATGCSKDTDVNFGDWLGRANVAHRDERSREWTWCRRVLDVEWGPCAG